MSQRTRSRTTAAAARKRPPATRKSGASPSSATPSPRGVGAQHVTPAGGGVSPSPSASSASSAPSAVPSSVTPSPAGVGAGHVPPSGPGGTDASLAPETLARTLRAVAAELERDPALARRLAAAISAGADPAAPTPAAGSAATSSGHPGAPAEVEAPQPAKRRPARAFTPSIITGVSPDLGPGIPDPFALARRLGPDGLRAMLADLRRGTLRAMIREHGIAPGAQVARIADDARLREMILAAVLK